MEKTDCGIVRDLLPLYMDGVCSEESSLFIEEHLNRCPDCRALRDAMGETLPASVSDVPAAEGEQVLRRTSRYITGQAIRAAAGVTFIIVYWLVFFWEKFLADMGDYRYFSYSFHELISGGTIFVLLITAVWSGILLIQILKERSWRKNGLLLGVLLLLLLFQAGYFHDRSQTVSTTSFEGRVTEITDSSHIVMIPDSRNESRTISLEVPPVVTPLLKMDGTTYTMTYEWRMTDPEHGHLLYIWDSTSPGTF